MTGAGNTVSWILIIAIAVCIGAYYLYRRGKQGKVSWLRGVKMPGLFEPKAETRIERLKRQTEKEVAKAEELRKVLDAKTELARARAENIRLLKEIDGVSEKSVEKDRQTANQAERGVQDVEKVKPKRL